jgi:hypothetical protein
MIVKDAITPKATIMIQILENASKDNPNFSKMQAKHVWNSIWKASISFYYKYVEDPRDANRKPENFLRYRY